MDWLGIVDTGALGTTDVRDAIVSAMVAVVRMLWFLVSCIVVGACVLIPELRRIAAALIVFAVVGFAVIFAAGYVLLKIIL